MDLYQTSLENLQALTLNIKDEFFTYDLKNIPLLEGINTLLNAIDAKGLKLTKKGFLPTKVVKSIVEVASTTADERFLKYQTRFYEEEHFSASLVRMVAEVLKLVRVQKGKLLFTKKGSQFLTFNKHQQYIILLNIMFGINLGYFDGHQEATCVHNSSLIMLQLLRDKNRDFRSVDVYSAILLESYPAVEDDIELLELYDYADKDQFEIYVSIAELRLFERLFLPLGLVEMQKAKTYMEDGKYAKSELLDHLIEEKNVINKELLFTKKTIKEFQDTIRTKNLEIDLFEETLFLFAQFADVPTPPADAVVESLMQKHAVIGTLRDEYEKIYRELIESVLTTYEEFTQLDTVGAKREDLVDEYMQMIDSFAALVQTPKPFTTVQRLQIVPMFIFDILKLRYDIDYTQEDFILILKEKLDEEFAMDVGNLMLLLEKLQKDAKKLKKNKPNFLQGVKEFIQNYFMIVLELRSRSL